MITAALGILSALIKLVELLGQSRLNQKEEREGYETILMLRRYQERLQRALSARKKIAANHTRPVDPPADSGSLPDDGFRRD